MEHLHKLYHEKSKSKTEQKLQKNLDGTYAIAETKPQRLFKKTTKWLTRAQQSC